MTCNYCMINFHFIYLKDLVKLQEQNCGLRRELNELRDSTRQQVTKLQVWCVCVCAGVGMYMYAVCYVCVWPMCCVCGMCMCVLCVWYICMCVVSVCVCCVCGMCMCVLQVCVVCAMYVYDANVWCAVNGMCVV